MVRGHRKGLQCIGFYHPSTSPLAGTRKITTMINIENNYYFIPFNAGTDLRRQNLTSMDDPRSEISIKNV